MDVERIYSSIIKMTDEVAAVSDTAQSGNEFYFQFKDRVFSVIRSIEDKRYYLHVYSRWGGTAADLQSLYDIGFSPPEEAKSVSFGYDELGEKGQILLAQLFKAIESKHAGIDDVWTDILEDGDIPF